MTSLSLIETEARRLLGRIPESQRLARQHELVAACERHWQALRGAEPTTPLAQVLWSITPPLADLLLDMYADADVRLAYDQLNRLMALLVMAEIESGNEAGVHLAHEPMMAYESAPPRTVLARIGALLRGTLEPPGLHAHDKRHDAMFKALAVIAAQAGIHFVSIDADHIYFTLHGHEHKPLRARHLGELLLELRQIWLSQMVSWARN